VDQIKSLGDLVRAAKHLPRNTLLVARTSKPYCQQKLYWHHPSHGGFNGSTTIPDDFISPCLPGLVMFSPLIQLLYTPTIYTTESPRRQSFHPTMANVPFHIHTRSEASHGDASGPCSPTSINFTAMRTAGCTSHIP